MNRKQAGLWCASPLARTWQFNIRSWAELQLEVRAPVSPRVFFLTQGHCPRLKALGGVIVAEMGKGTASSRPCCASTPDGQALTSPVPPPPPPHPPKLSPGPPCQASRVCSCRPSPQSCFLSSLGGALGREASILLHWSFPSCLQKAVQSPAQPWTAVARNALAHPGSGWEF